MTDDPKYLIRTSKISKADGYHIRHPMQADAEVHWANLSEKACMERAHLNIAHIPPGKVAFPVHSHAMQEEFVYIVSGTGLARIGEDDFPVGPGDYLGFPADGTPHGLRNTGENDLICLMGGERTATEVATFPELGKVAVQHEGGMTFYGIGDGETRKISDWLKDD
jgi:uncharacterized cupin superfamily protein